MSECTCPAFGTLDYACPVHKEVILAKIADSIHYLAEERRFTNV